MFSVYSFLCIFYLLCFCSVVIMIQNVSGVVWQYSCLSCTAAGG